MDVPISSLQLSDYASTLDDEAKKRYIEKISVFGGPDPYLGKKQSRPIINIAARELPETTFHDIYCYLIESKSKLFTGRCLKAYKSLEAYKYFVAGHVNNVMLTEADTPRIKLITTKVSHTNSCTRLRIKLKS